MAALVAGLLLALWRRAGPATPLVLALAGLSATLAVVGVRRGRASLAFAALAVTVGLVGWAWGGARLATTAPPSLDLPGPVSGTLVVDTPPVPDGRGGWRARASADRLVLAGRRGREVLPSGTRLLLDLPAGRRPPVLGTRLRVSGGLGPPASPLAPGWWRDYLARQGIAGRLRPRRLEALGRRGGLAGLRDRWRVWAGEHAASGLSGDRGALVRGMALGGSTGLSRPAEDAFRDAGLWHLLAVSGQNVAVVALATAPKNALGRNMMSMPTRIKLGMCAAAATGLLWGPIGTPAIASAAPPKAKPAHAKVSPEIRKALHQRDKVIRSLRAQLKEARKERQAALQAEAQSQSQVGDLQGKLDAATSTITSLQGQMASFPPQISALEQQINGMVGGVDQQIRVLSTQQAWSLLPALYSRFPTDPLAAYSASVFRSGTYVSYTFTYSP